MLEMFVFACENVTKTKYNDILKSTVLTSISLSAYLL